MVVNCQWSIVNNPHSQFTSKTGIQLIKTPSAEGVFIFKIVINSFVPAQKALK